MYRSEGKQKETAPDADQQSKDSQSLTKIQEDKAEQESLRKGSPRELPPKCNCHTAISDLNQ